MHLAHDGATSEEGDPRRILLVGTRTLFLQALCEFLECTTRLSVSLISPAQLNDSRPGRSPDVVVLDCSASSDGLETVGATLREIYNDARIVLLTLGSARESSQKAVSLRAADWASMTLPVSELVTVLDDSEKARGSGPLPSRRRRPPPLIRVAGRLSSLTERELSVLQLLVDGRSAGEIAAMLGISPNTVRTHLQNMMAKLLVNSRTELVNVARSVGIRPRPIEPPS